MKGHVNTVKDMVISKGRGVIKEHPSHTSKGPTNVNMDNRTDHKGKGVIKENPAKANTKDNANQKDGNNSNNSYSTITHTSSVTLRVERELTLIIILLSSKILLT